ncbi:bestrophin family protein [[Phormidium] sp. LEGE 05292]|uniref:bestrophin family protein n=1 Tax=[Phormidium] sp. LEGE 05292 TaxID=767427 RepID=UPI001D159712|nr:bestrophin family ion channel [Phormidium sp. LEGE 05292]
MNETVSWFKMALQLKESVIIKVLPRAFICSLFGGFISLVYYSKLPLPWHNLETITNNVVFGLVLGLLLVFRTNTAYDRFWEGRKAWGTLVVNIRSLARQIHTSVAIKEETDQSEKNQQLKLLVAFAIVTKLHLRKETVTEELETLISLAKIEKLKQAKTPPLEIILWLGEYIQKEGEKGCLNSYQLTAMNQLLDKLVEGLTNCERILTTPIPMAYVIYLKRLLLIYFLFLPFQLVTYSEWLTAFLVFLISLALFGIEEIGNEIQEPFGYDQNDLSLEQICQTIQSNMEDIIALSESNNSEIKREQDVMELDNFYGLN